MRLAITLCALVLAACAEPVTKGADPAPSNDAAAGAAETSLAPETAEPALAVASVPPGRYTAISRTATSVTGDLTLGDVALTFDLGQTYATQRVSVMELTQPVSPGGDTFGQIWNTQANTGVEIRRVTNQQLAAAARNGSMCGRDAVTFVALFAGRGADGMPGLWIAAFKGANAPGEANAAAADLCGTFSYAPASL